MCATASCEIEMRPSGEASAGAEAASTSGLDHLPRTGVAAARHLSDGQGDVPIRRASRLLVMTATALVLAAVAPAFARASTDLGPIGFGTMVVDDARGHVLVSGPTGNVVEILDFSGNVVGTIPNIYGAHGMVVSGR